MAKANRNSSPTYSLVLFAPSHSLRMGDFFRKAVKIKYEGHRFKTEAQQTAGLSPSSINTRLKTLRVFFRCLVSEGLLDTNPTHGVTNVPEPQEKITILTPEEMKRLTFRIKGDSQTSATMYWVCPNCKICAPGCCSGCGTAG
ncbi:integrase domain protein SAM domain protein [Heyndrickxia coagulans 36D1]|uniref:Integrase domain protein SAM domain protein n=1 Tax=Heyndrickxia coagulans 36D1 TaxID=345219 RepID=G2TMM4_HEYCO|nr:integrase domain protein SAM domain protein [Heyndrickxia coagulans 36D1]